MRTHRLLLPLAGMLVFGCNGSTQTSDATSGDASDVADVATSDGGACTPSDAGDTTGYYIPAGYTLTPFLAATATHDFAQADMVLESCKHYEAVIETDVGRVVLDFYDQQTPITTNSFVFLARNHYFDGIAFHRVVPGFVAQGGDPNTLMTNRTTWGAGGPGYTFGLEIDPSLTFDAAGVVGMARTMDPNSNGSQFFITYSAQHGLDAMYTVFARVTEGMDVVGMFATGSPPATPTLMQRVYIVERRR